jgi:hypothetical protein
MKITIPERREEKPMQYQMSYEDLRYIWSRLSEEQKNQLNKIGVHNYRQYISNEPETRTVVVLYLNAMINREGWPKPERFEVQEEKPGYLSRFSDWLERVSQRLTEFVVNALNRREEKEEKEEETSEKRRGLWASFVDYMKEEVEFGRKRKIKVSIEEAKKLKEAQKVEKKERYIPGWIKFGLGFLIFTSICGFIAAAAIVALWFVPELTRRAALDGLTWYQFIARVVLTGN